MFFVGESIDRLNRRPSLASCLQNYTKVFKSNAKCRTICVFPTFCSVVMWLVWISIKRMARARARHSPSSLWMKSSSSVPVSPPASTLPSLSTMSVKGMASIPNILAISLFFFNSLMCVHVAPVSFTAFFHFSASVSSDTPRMPSLWNGKVRRVAPCGASPACRDRTNWPRSR